MPCSSSSDKAAVKMGAVVVVGGAACTTAAAAATSLSVLGSGPLTYQSGTKLQHVNFMSVLGFRLAAW